MKNRLLFVISLVLFFIIILFNSFNASSKRKVEKIVLDYLKDKYHEEFKVDDYKVYNYTYEEDIVLADAYVHELEVVSQRLVRFKVYYYEYKDNSFEHNKEKNLILPGIYENYIYEYKIREMENKYYKDIMDIVDKSDNIVFSLDNISIGVDNIPFKYKDDDKEVKDLYDKYHSYKKNVKDEEFLNTYFALSMSNEVIITMDVNKEINKDNIDEFKKEIKTLVKYLKNNNIIHYDINMNLNGYVNARATRYIDNGKEQIYLVFDYPSYFNPEDCFNVIVFDL